MVYNREKKRKRNSIDCLSCKFYDSEKKKCVGGIGKVCFEYDEQTKTAIDPVTKLPIKI